MIQLDSITQTYIGSQDLMQAVHEPDNYKPWVATIVKANFLVNLGVADPAGIRPRNARLPFAEVAQIL